MTSGRVVPMDTTVAPMSSSGTWKRRAMPVAPSTNQSPPLIRHSRPTINNRTGISIISLLFNNSGRGTKKDPYHILPKTGKCDKSLKHPVLHRAFLPGVSLQHSAPVFSTKVRPLLPFIQRILYLFSGKNARGNMGFILPWSLFWRWGKYAPCGRCRNARQGTLPAVR